MIDNYEDFKSKERIRIIKQNMQELGVESRFLGFKFIITAISIMIDHKDEKIVLEDLYRKIAKKHKSTASKVYQNIRYVVEVNSYIANLKPGFIKPNNSTFLFFLKDRVETELAEKCLL